MMLVRNKAIFLVKNVFAVLSIYLFSWQCSALIYCSIKHRHQQTCWAMPSGKPTISSYKDSLRAKGRNKSTLGLTSPGWLILAPFTLPETRKGGRCTALGRMQVTKQLSIVRGNGVSLVCWPSAIGFPFCWMVNLTVTSNLTVSFDGREAKKGNDEDEDRVGLGLPRCLSFQEILPLNENDACGFLCS